jgi:hypothetical protein
MKNQSLLNVFSPLTFLFLMSALPVLGQGKAPYSKAIRLVKDENRVKSKIEFWDSTSVRRNLVLDLYGINPFGKLDAPYTRVNDFGTPVYQLDTLKPVDTLNDIELVSKINHYATSRLKPFKLWSRFTTYTGEKVAAVGFELTTINSSGRNISTHSMVKIYNSEGQLLHKTPIWDINLSSTPIVTEDARFIAFKVGGPYGWEQSGYIKNELWVYDCTKKEVIFKEKNCEIGINMDIIEGRLINDATTIPHVSTTDIIYDFYNNIKYSRVLTFTELPSIHSTNLYGVYFLNERGEKYIKYTFDKDFLKTKILE